MIDMSALVLGPALAVFGRPMVVTPTVSQPGEPEYLARGAWQVRAGDDVILQDGEVLSSEARTIGIRLIDFETPPVAGDFIEMPPCMSLQAVPRHIIDDVDVDGQGGAILAMKQA